MPHTFIIIKNIEPHKQMLKFTFFEFQCLDLPFHNNVDTDYRYDDGRETEGTNKTVKLNPPPI